MNSSEVPNSRRSAETRSSTSASTVASSAVVGSSRISSDGSDASAIAITTRWSMPPDSWCGIAVHHAGRIGDPHLVEHLLGALERLRLSDAGELEHLGHLAPDLERGVERAAGLLVDHRHRALARSSRSSPPFIASTSRPSISILPAVTLPLRAR